MGANNYETADKKSIISDLIHAYENDVWNYVFTLTAKFDLADDITQDVFIRAYQNYETFRGESSVKTWLLAIARNLVINYRRSAFYRKVVLVEVFFERGSFPSAEAEVMQKTALNEVWNAVLKLPSNLREVLVLQVTQQLPVVEISELLGISQGAVKSRLHRARTKVSSLLMKEGELGE